MKAFVTVFVCLVAAASASHLVFLKSAGGGGGGFGGFNMEAHIPSGSVMVGNGGATVQGPAGVVHTENSPHGASAIISTAAGSIKGQDGFVSSTGAGFGGDGGDGGHGGSGGAGGVAVALLPIFGGGGGGGLGGGSGGFMKGGW